MNWTGQQGGSQDANLEVIAVGPQERAGDTDVG